jgi:poly(3-hydroxybutyrate) depolymerase
VVDDVQFFRDILDDLSSLANVDRLRVHVNGFSNGGMSVRIACGAADKVAAAGSVSRHYPTAMGQVDRVVV